MTRQIATPWYELPVKSRPLLAQIYFEVNDVGVNTLKLNIKLDF